MSEMIEVNDVVRLNQVLSVIGLMIERPELTQAEACSEVGINLRTFQRWREHSKDVIIEIQKTIHEIETEELVTIMQARQMILPHVVRDGVNAMTDPSTRLRIYESMTRHQEELVDKVRSLDHNVDPTLFNGPELEIKQSRFASPTIDVTVKDGQYTINIKENEIIDAQTHEASAEQEK